MLSYCFVAFSLYVLRFLICIYVQVVVGDVIYIEANSGAVKRVGRSDAFASEFDLEAEEYVPLPKGEVHKKKEIVQVCGVIPCFWFCCVS